MLNGMVQNVVLFFNAYFCLLEQSMSISRQIPISAITLIL